MRMRPIGAVLLLLGIGCLRAKTDTATAEHPKTTGAAESPWVDVKDVKVEQIGAGRRLTIQLTRTPEYYNDWIIGDPPRLIVDVGGPLAQYPMPPERFTVGDEFVRQVRIGSHGPNLRAVLDLAGDVSQRRVRHDGPNLIVDLGDVPAAEATGAIPTVTAEAAGDSRTAPAEAAAAPVQTAALDSTEPQPLARAAAKPSEVPAPSVATVTETQPVTLPEPTLAHISVEPTPAADATAPAEPASKHARSTGAKTLTVRDVKLETVGAGRRVRIDLSREPDGLHDFRLSGPSRLVIDLEGPAATAAAASAKYSLGDSVVSRVRVAPFEGKLRVVLDLEGEGEPHAVRQEGSALIADLGQLSSNERRSEKEPVRVAANAARNVPPVLSDANEAFDTHTPPPLRGDEPMPVFHATISPPPDPPEAVAAVRHPAPADARDDDRLVPVLAVAQAAEMPADTEPTPDPIQLAAADEPSPVEAPAAVEPTPERPARLQREVTAVEAEEPSVPSSRRARARDRQPDLADGPTRVAAMPSPRRPVPVTDDTHVYRGQRISMDFKDADIQNVLRVLADVSGLNLIATDDVKGKVTLHLSDVPWDQALDLVLRSNRLEKTQEGNIVRISSVTRFKEEREALRAAMDAEKDVEPLKVHYNKVNYARADEALIDKVKGVLTERGSVTFDDRTNTVIVRDIARGISDAEQLIHELDVQSPQVLIEAHIVEATEDFARGLGVQWGYSYNAGPATGNPTGMNFPGTVGVGGAQAAGGKAPSGLPGVPSVPVPFLADFPVPASFGSGDAASSLGLLLGSLDGSQALAAKLTALEEAGKGKVISRPRVITLNNVAATIQSLTILRVKLPSTGTVINTGAGGVAGGGSSATEKINTGITLVVTPQISSDGFVLMNIYAKSSQPDFSKTVDGIPNEVSREANSNVLVKDNETVVLGGIYRQNTDDRESGIPYLRSVPGIGWLFKRDLKTDHHEELIVFLTPKIVATGGTAKQLPVADRLWEERRRGG